MPKSLESLKAEAEKIGIAYPLDIKAAELQDIINEYVKNNAVPSETLPPPTTPTEDLNQKTPEQLAEESRLSQEAFQASQKASGRTYTAEQVDARIQEALRQFAAQQDGQPKPEEHVHEHTLRLSRFQNKFVIGFKDMNSDEYVKEPIYAYDVLNQETRKYEPWVTAQFDDGSELSVRLESLLKSVASIVVPIIEVKKKDTSFVSDVNTPSKGMVESRHVTAYDDGKTGHMIPAKVTQATYTYLVELPDKRQVDAQSQVVNW